MPKISVIIPVYNVSEYLEKCLWSVTNQTLRDIEIIVVNDGSTDNSLSIIQKYAANDSRITIIDKQNEGVSYARKSGLEIATGDYIHHLDGDDYIEPNCYELLYEKAVETDADLTVMRFWFDDPKKNELTESKPYEKEVFSNVEFLNQILQLDGYSCLWQFIHKKELLDNGLIFERKLHVGEDTYLTTQLGYYSKKIVVLNTLPLLHYIKRPDSAINCKMSDIKMSQIALYTKLIYEFLSGKPEYNLLEKNLSILFVTLNTDLFYNKYFKNGHERCKTAMKMMKKYPFIKEMINIRPFYKMIKHYAICGFLGMITANYYLLKGKIK